jgi:hypothetical protein
VQGRLAEWLVANGRLSTPLAGELLDGYAAPGKKWVIRISQEAVLGGTFPVVKGRDTEDAKERPTLTVLRVIRP